MLKHEQYEELCTLAMIGEVSPAEMEHLREHLRECATCGDQYREFTQFLLPQLSISSDKDGAFETGYSQADRERLRKGFLAAAQKGGRRFTPDALRGSASGDAPPQTIAIRHAGFLNHYPWSVAASVAALFFAGGYATHLILPSRQSDVTPSVAGIVASKPAAPAAPVDGNNREGLAQLRATNNADAKTIAGLQEKLSATVAQLEQTQHTSEISDAEHARVQALLNQKNSQIADIQAQAQGGQQSVADLQAQVAQLQQRLNESQTILAVNESHMRDLNEQLSSQTASLDRERQMLTVGRDVRDLMGARNLHIIDVHDANGAGKDRKSMGRIFYTEGRQLIFYAFDLDDKKVNASYSYEAWGERLGQPGSVKSLGILYVDDKEQRRWSLKVDDPHQLAEINSVFVTLETNSADGAKPQGKKILFAFLGGQANHP